MSNFNELAKVLALEQSKGYTNKSTVGGIETYVDSWAKRTRAPENESVVAQIVSCFENYAQAEPPARKAMIERALSIARQINTTAPAAPPTRAQKHAPRAPHPQEKQAHHTAEKDSARHTAPAQKAPPLPPRAMTTTTTTNAMRRTKPRAKPRALSTDSIHPSATSKASARQKKDSWKNWAS